MKNWLTSCIHNLRRPVPFCLFLTVLMLLAACANITLGAAKVSLPEILKILLTGQGDSGNNAGIILYLRLPRCCAALLAGATMSMSGAIIQSVLANPLAAPNIIGVNAGAGLMVALSCALIPSAVWLTPLAAFLGAFMGVMLVLGISERTGASRISLILAGVAISNIFSAGIDAIVTLVPEALTGYSDFRIGGLSGVTMRQLGPACAVILPGILLALSLAGQLDVLTLGSETAQSLGLSVRKMRTILLMIAAALAGAAVSFSGLLGFVGLIVPHIMRRLVGQNSLPLLISSALGGAVLLSVCDLLARTLFAPYVLPVGIVMSFVGGPFFIWLLFRQRGGRTHD